MNGLLALLKSIWPGLQVVLHASLFIVATTIVFIDEARSAALVSAFHGLWAVMLVIWSWQAWVDWRKGLLSLPLSQLHRQIAQGQARRSSLLEVAAMLMGIAAMLALI